jgi:hypothetical protein
MKSIIYRIAKIISKILIGFIMLIILIYLGLWIYTINYVQDEWKYYYKNYEIKELNENQYEIIWFILTQNKNYKSKWYPFLFDIIIYIMKQENTIEGNLNLMTAETILIHKFYYRDLNNAHLRYYSFERYIGFDNNWKKCISIIMNNFYFGNEIYNLEDASIFYFNKNIKNITEKELIGLLLINRINLFGSELYNDKIDKLYNGYKNE